jgi:hypothetical protein
MPAIEIGDRTQKAVLWAASGSFDQDGEPTLAAATEITVRWLESQDGTLVVDGNTIQIDAKVIVDRDIPIDSVMWLGALEDIATPPVDLKRVAARKHTPDIKGRETRRVLTLVRHSNELPVLA